MSDSDRQIEDEKAGVSRRDVLRTSAKVGVAAAAAAGLAGGAALPALAATRDTAGKGQFTGWAGLSVGEVNVLRMVAMDPQFRARFVQAPKAAIKSTGEKLTTSQINNLSRMSKLQAENFASNVQLAVKSEVGSTAGTGTLLHAIAYAVIIAILLAVQAQEGVATGGGAVPIF